MANLLFSLISLTEMADSLLSDSHTGMADSEVFSEVPTGTADSLLSEGSTEMMADSVLLSEVPTGMADSQVSQVCVYMFSVTQWVTCI